MNAMPTEPLRAVTDQERRAFDTDGVVALRAIHPRDRVDQLRVALDEVFERSGHDPDATWTGVSHTGDRSDMAEVMSSLREAGADVALDGEAQTPITGRAIVETDAAFWHQGLRRHHLDSGLGRVVAELTGSSKVNFYSDQVFSKEPGSRSRTPWHQDAPYFLVGEGAVAVCWVPVDEVTVDSGAMGYVPGSHRWGKSFKPSDFVTRTGTFSEVGDIDLSGLDDLPDPSTFEDDVVYLEAEPGDVIVHHWCTVHGSSGNTTAASRRRAASVRYACLGAKFSRKASSPEPFRNTVELAEGDPLELDPRFPVVWPRQR